MISQWRFFDNYQLQSRLKGLHHHYYSTIVFFSALLPVVTWDFYLHVTKFMKKLNGVY